MVGRFSSFLAVQLALFCNLGVWATNTDTDLVKADDTLPVKVYVPYDELTEVFESENQGVFLPYGDFEKLWRAAKGKPAGVETAPYAYLISTARFTGGVSGEIARLRLELTVDVLREGWVEVPIGLGEVAVNQAEFVDSRSAQISPLLRVVNGQYVMLTKGAGRYVLGVEFVQQLETKPGLHTLRFKMPSAAITTLELTIPEENMKVDVEPMLAATTSQVQVAGKDSTRLQAFLGSAKEVKLSWKPRTQAAVEMEPVIVCDQYQDLHVAEALIRYEVKLNYTIHRSTVDLFTVQLPGEFRVTDVTGANIARWDIESVQGQEGKVTEQLLKVKLYSATKDSYALTVKLERFLQEEKVALPLKPIVTHQVLRRSGLIGITYTQRRQVQLKEVKNLARVDTGRLPKPLQKQAGVTAYRFITSDYGGTLDIQTAAPRITVNQQWMLGVGADRLQLRGKLGYKVERRGIFEIRMQLADPWEIESVGPANLVDDHQVKQEGAQRVLHILLKSERSGSFNLDLAARADRQDAAAAVNFTIPLAEARDVQLYQGQIILLLAEQLRAEIAGRDQVQSLPLRQVKPWAQIPGMSASMAFEFRSIDRTKRAGVDFNIAVKPAQISATVHRLVNIQPSSVRHEAVIQYQIRYAPVDTFYLKIPKSLADEEVNIQGANIKEKPRLDSAPAEKPQQAAKWETAAEDWVYYKVVLQEKVLGAYTLHVSVQRSFQADEGGRPSVVAVEPILAAGDIAYQNGFVTVAKADTLAIGEPESKNLTPGDPSSAVDLPYDSHRNIASLAFRYNVPPYALSLPVVFQKEARVFTTIVNGVVVEQELTRDGELRAHVIYLLSTSKGDRLPITLPEGAQLTAMLLNGNETPMEMGMNPQERIIRLPHSAGKVSRFVLEISYGLESAKASSLTAPELPKEIPVQQTLWRVSLAKDYYVLHIDRSFAPLQSVQVQNLLRRLGTNQPSSVSFTLSPQGQVLHFVRQGAPGTLSIQVMGKEVFCILLWFLIVAVGIVMLKLGAYHRLLVILGAGLLMGILHLFVPLFVRRAAWAGGFGVVIVLLLWLLHWLFQKYPNLRPLRIELLGKKVSKPKSETTASESPPVPRAPADTAQEPEINQDKQSEDKE